jgi:hypothetical protein
MDGLAHSNALVFVLAATNLPWELDMVRIAGAREGMGASVCLVLSTGHLPARIAGLHTVEDQLAAQWAEVCLGGIPLLQRP